MPAATPLLEDLVAYTGFDENDARALAEARALVEPSFDGIVDAFYDAITRSPGAMEAMREGPAQVPRLKGSLRRWLEGVFGGVYDAAYLERRARIGRRHVAIQLDQRYMFAAMSVMRSSLHDALAAAAAHWPAPRRERTHRAVDRICDIELAIMLETYREAYLARMRNTERLATLGQLAATIGHELRNPLAVIDTSVHLLRRRLGDDERTARHLGRIGEQTALSNAIIADLLELARDREPSREPTALEPLIDRVLDGLPSADAVVMEVDVPDGLPPARVDPGQFRQLLVNLVTNAVQATLASTPGGTVRIAARAEGDALHLTVRDDGPGLTPEVQRRLFEPLFTTRSKGVGLGLALCKRIVEKHRGSIRGTNDEAGGARFEVVLPGALEVRG